MADAFAAIVAAGKVAGSAGNAQATATYQDQGVRYLYTHLTTLLASASADFLGRVRRGA
jgi:4-hydroxy-2-oxoheptanedioate aldolase